jgi:Transposase DDE domain
MPLGLLHQELIYREREYFGKSKQTHNRQTIDKESNKWIEGIQTGKQFSTETGRQTIHLMDRESDVIDVINECIAANQNFIIRARHDRSTISRTESDKLENLEQYRLHSLMRNSKSKKTITKTLRNKNGKEYSAKCYIHYETFKFRSIKKAVQCVWIKEMDAQDGEEQVEWFILTNLPVTTIEDAEKIIFFYSKRWTIEDFHKCYKTGCSIEKRQFDSRKGMENSIGLLGIVAVELLRIRYYAIEYNDVHISKLKSDKDEIKLIKALAKEYLKPIDLTICKKYTVL